jgi:hypothetical protein
MLRGIQTTCVERFSSEVYDDVEVEGKGSRQKTYTVQRLLRRVELLNITRIKSDHGIELKKEYLGARRRVLIGMPPLSVSNPSPPRNETHEVELSKKV